MYLKSLNLFRWVFTFLFFLKYQHNFIPWGARLFTLRLFLQDESLEKLKRVQSQVKDLTYSYKKSFSFKPFFCFRECKSSIEQENWRSNKVIGQYQFEIVFFDSFKSYSLRKCLILCFSLMLLGSLVEFGMRLGWQASSTNRAIMSYL